MAKSHPARIRGPEALILVTSFLSIQKKVSNLNEYTINMSFAEFHEWILMDPGPRHLLRAAHEYVKQMDTTLPEQLVQESAVRLLYRLSFPDEQEVRLNLGRR